MQMPTKNSHIKSLVYKSTDLQKLEEDMYRKIGFLIHQFKDNCHVIETLSNGNVISWLKSEELLFRFYELLATHKYIDCNFTFFQSHLMGNEPTQGKITFLKPTNQLPYIIKALEEIGFIAECDQPHIRLAQRFFNRFGKPISNTVLRSSLEKGLGGKAKQFVDKNIIDELLKYKI